MAIIAIISVGFAQQKYAILITGDNDALNVPVNDQWNSGLGMGDYGYDEFWNDTYLFWEILYDQKDYLNENIYVLYDEGVDLSFSEQADRYNALETYGFNITDQSATQSNIQGIFNTLANTITENDFLFVWVMSHGGTDAQGSYFYSYDAHKIYDTQLASWLNHIDAYKKTVFLSTPGSGGFTDELEGERTIVITSSGEGEGASRADNEAPGGGLFIENEVIPPVTGITYNHGEANYHLYSSLAGETPDFQTINN